MAKSIEKLYVEIGADVSDLLDDTKKGVDQAEKELKGFERTGKKAFDNTAKSAGGLDVKVTALAASAGAFVAVFASQALTRVVGFFQQIGAAAIQSNAQFEKFTSQFKTVLGSTGAAEKRLKELAKFGEETPFELPEVVIASQQLQTFGGDILATGENLRMVGDIAAGVNQPFADVAIWIGRMYDSMQSGRPFGEASARLQEMGALSGIARAELEKLQKEGASGEVLWTRFNELVGEKYQGSMDDLSKTFQGVTSNLIDFKDGLMRIGGEAFFEVIRDSAADLQDILKDNEAEIQDFAVAVGKIAAVLGEAVASPLLAELEALEAEELRDMADAFTRASMSLQELTSSSQEIEGGTLEGAIDTVTVLADAFTIVSNSISTINEKLPILSTLLGGVGDAAEIAAQGVVGAIVPSANLLLNIDQLNEATETLTGIDIAGWFSEAAEATETEAQASQKSLDAQAARAEGLALMSQELAAATDETETLTEAIEEQNEKAVGLLDTFAGQMIDLTEERDEELQALEAAHTERLTEIETEYIANRLELGNQLADDLEQLEQDTAEKRGDILAGTRAKLEKVESDTDTALRDQQKSFRKDERRETEDHLREMRELRRNFLLSVEDAVKTRDARALVDARSRFEAERTDRENNFQINQGRDREDQDERLVQIRENEARRTAEILANQEVELANLAEAEAKKKAQLQASFEEDIAKLDENHAAQLTKENAQFEERQAKLDEVLAERLEKIAKGLADEKDLNETEAKAILDVLNETFGAGGDIDQLMDDFASRRSQKLVVQVGFEENIQQAGKVASINSGAISSVPAFAEGGTLLANKPTLAQFGEVPELVQFTPLSQLRRGGGGGPQKMEVDLKLSGSAPPGIMETDRDAIAGLMVNALRQAGLGAGQPSR